MKKIIYIVFCVAIISCSNSNKKDMKSMEVDEAIEEYYDIPIEKSNLDGNYDYYGNESFKFKDLTSQKLQELYDLLALQNQHPEFNETIKLQLESYTNDNSINLDKTAETVSIENIQLLDNDTIFKTSDSIQKIKISYDVTSKGIITKDSIYAEVRSEKIVLDDKEIVSNKILFSRTE